MIAAKQVAAAESLDGEVAVLAKLAHPCVMALYGVAKDPEGSLAPSLRSESQ